MKKGLREDKTAPLELSQQQAAALVALAIEQKDAEALKRLLDAGADANSVLETPQRVASVASALGRAAGAGSLELTQALLAAGADATGRASGALEPRTAQKLSDSAPLEVCCDQAIRRAPQEAGYAEWAKELGGVMEALIAAGADATRPEPWARLCVALEYRGSASPLWFKALVEGGADVETRAPGGKSALWIAVNEMDEALVQALLELGANPTKKVAIKVSFADDSETPMQAALRMGNDAVTAIMTAHVERRALEKSTKSAPKSTQGDGVKNRNRSL